MDDTPWKRFTCYCAARLREASTYQALILIATAAGVKITDDQHAAVVTIGLGIAGVLGAVFPDRLGGQTRASDKDQSNEKTS